MLCFHMCALPAPSLCACCAPAWKHSQYFFRHPLFLQLQPLLCLADPDRRLSDCSQQGSRDRGTRTGKQARDKMHESVQRGWEANDAACLATGSQGASWPTPQLPLPFHKTQHMPSVEASAALASWPAWPSSPLLQSWGGKRWGCARVSPLPLPAASSHAPCCCGSSCSCSRRSTAPMQSTRSTCSTAQYGRAGERHTACRDKE